MTGTVERQSPVVWILIVSLAMGVACDGDEGRPSALRVSVDSSTLGYPVIEMSHHPTEISSGSADVELLSRSISLGEDGTFGVIGDIAGSPSGLLVLDRSTNEIIVIGRSGEEVTRFGTEGEGPGDLQHPFSITATDSTIFVLDANERHPLKVFTLAGEFRTAVREPVIGDWSRLRFRRPYAWEMRPVQWTWERASRRLQRSGANQIALFRQNDEVDAYFADQELDTLWNPDAALVLVSESGEASEFTQIEGVPLSRVSEQAGGFPVFRNVVYGGVPLWATGRGWIALGHGDSTRVVILDVDDPTDTLAVVQWPSRRREVDRELRHRFGRWVVSERFLRFGSRSDSQRVSSLSEAALEEGDRWHEAQNVWGDHVPYLTQLYGSGRCLWLAGFDVEDFRDGGSLTLIGIPLHRPSGSRVVRAPATPGRVLDIVGSEIWVSHHSAGALQLLTSYELPEMSCRVDSSDHPPAPDPQ